MSLVVVPAGESATSRIRVLAVALVVLVLVAVSSASAPAQATAGRRSPDVSGAGAEGTDGPDVVAEWFEQTDAALTRAALPTQVTGSRIWATSWLAALRAIGGGAGRHGSTSETAAVATAVHDTLVGWLPDQVGPLDAALATTLDRLPDGRAERRGRETGAAEAARVLAERAEDGLDVAEVNVDFTPPPEAPGVWRLTPGATRAVQAGQGRGQPFLLDRVDRFRPAAPPALGTPGYRAGLDEVQRLGGTTSTDRTAAQANVGLVWAQTSLRGYTSVLRALVGQPDQPVRARVRLLAVFHAVTVDAQIAVYEAKYHHLHWRPVTAIRSADTDGDPLTAADPAWTPLITTPAHPEYPSGHAGYAGAAEEVLEALVGRRSPVAFTLDRRLDTGEMLTLPYAAGVRWAQLTQDNVDARVWTGIHFRFSDEIGAILGRQVARHDLSRLDRLTS